ncbi:amidohydrolase 2 [Corynespora cassiicola Philippines]|uniref:Amidohydrolase 2 n=1 Tax=Corynespora cassiicola Philippines TaxID=1448308 RepID=A0A2T2P337_CORCC|nr:amidohydrolase 2 [Corynespora cassiicola Philippines]
MSKHVYTIDTHTHALPNIMLEALVTSGRATRKDSDPTGLYVDGHLLPNFTVPSYLENREKWGYDYSVLSITAPGVSFLNNVTEERELARKINDEMFDWTQKYPDKLGAFACLPLPNIEAAIEEARYCLDDLHFEGIGIFTNYEGRYIGDSYYDPLFEELNRRKATVFVHPVAPIPEPKITEAIASPILEYPVDSTRAVASLLFTQWRKRFPDITMIFSHGGGFLPFLAHRLAFQTTEQFHGGWDYNESFDVLKSFYFDLAGTTGEAQLAALMSFVGPDRLLFATDYPYYPERLLQLQEDGFKSYGFTPEEVKKIRSENALAILPTIKDKIIKD